MAQDEGIEMEPTVSIVMSVYNGGEVMELAHDSCLAQTLSDFQSAIISDESKDDALERLGQCDKHAPDILSPFKRIRQPVA